MIKEKLPPPGESEALTQVSAPALGLLITGILGAIISLTHLIAISIGLGLSTLYVDEIPDFFEGFFEGSFAVGIWLVGLAVDAFVIYAALKMKELKLWGLAVAASVIAIIPCTSPCCILGLPIGIWCLVVLMRPEVQNAFS